MAESAEIPFYEPGKPPQFYRYHREIDYLDELEKIWGKRWGAQGIGKLREVVVGVPSRIDRDMFPAQYPFMPPVSKRAVKLMQEQHENMVSVYKKEGIKVHYQELPEGARSAYGTLLEPNVIFAATNFVINGGAIIAREGQPFWRGKSRYDAQFLMNLGCPILYTIHGMGIGEVGAFTRMADDFILVMLSTDCNQDCLEQIRPILERSGYKEILAARNPGVLNHFHNEYLEWAHSDMWITPVDVRLALIYPPYCDYETIRRLTELGYELIEVPEEEMRQCCICNSVTLEPRRMLMPEGAPKTVEALKNKGVEVIEIPADELEKFGGGIRCATGQLVRDPGPKLFEQ